MNSLRPVDTSKWQVVTPVYFSGGLAAALLLVLAVLALEGLCGCCPCEQAQLFPVCFRLSSLTVSNSLSRQLVVVQSDRRGQRASVVNRSYTEQCHLFILHGW